MAVSFFIDAHDTLDFRQNQLPRLSRTSLWLRRVLSDTQRPQTITLPPDDDRGTDARSIRYLLENLERDQQQTSDAVCITDLSRLCNTIHHFECDPDPFGALWDQLTRRWTVRPRPVDIWCWRLLPQPGYIREKQWVHHAITAWVLGKDEEFADAIHFIVFDSACDTLKTSVEVLRNVRGYRHRYMEQVFGIVTGFIQILNNGSANEQDIGRTMLRRIRDSPDLDIHLTGAFDDRGRLVSAWERSIAKLSTRAIYEFVLQLDIDLLRDTSKEFDPDGSPSGSSSSFTSHSQQDSDTASTLGTNGPKRFARLRIKRAVKGVLLPKHYVEKVEGMFRSIHDQILRDQAELTSLLINARSRMLDRRRTQLETGNLAIGNVQANGHNHVPQPQPQFAQQNRLG